jgi:hypothetical protein
LFAKVSTILWWLDVVREDKTAAINENGYDSNNNRVFSLIKN